MNATPPLTARQRRVMRLVMASPAVLLLAYLAAPGAQWALAAGPSLLLATLVALAGPA